MRTEHNEVQWDDTRRMRIEYQEVLIQAVFNYFVGGFNMKDEEKIVRHESTYDPRTGKVIFKLYIAKPEEITNPCAQ